MISIPMDPCEMKSMNLKLTWLNGLENAGLSWIPILLGYSLKDLGLMYAFRVVHSNC